MIAESTRENLKIAPAIDKQHSEIVFKCVSKESYESLTRAVDYRIAFEGMFDAGIYFQIKVDALTFAKYHVGIGYELTPKAGMLSGQNFVGDSVARVSEAKRYERNAAAA